MICLLNFNITYIISLATCFDSYESSSGNFQELLYMLFLCLTVFLCLSRTIAIWIPLCITKPGLSPSFVMHKSNFKWMENNI